MFAFSLLYWHWEAMLISHLATRVVELPFTSVAELLKNTDYKIVLLARSSHEDFFKNSIDPDLQQAWKTRIQPYLNQRPWQGEDFPEQMKIIREQDENLALFANVFNAE